MPPKHSLETLTVTAAFSWCMTDFLDKLGAGSTPGRRAALWARLGQLGVDTSHWDRSPHRTYPDDILRRAVAASESFAGVLRFMGLKQAGGTQAHIARRVRAAQIDTSHFLGMAHNRGKPGRAHRQPEEVLTLLPAGSHRVRRKTLLRAMIACGTASVCATCKIGPEWNGEPLTLAIDHVNGEWLDNRLSNLRFLCPNCHAQTSTWCWRKGS